MEYLENKTYDELKLGDTATFGRTLTEKEVLLFAASSGDMNPMHVDADYAAAGMFGERVAHGMWSGSLISAALALALPGPGTIYAGQTLRFSAPIKLGDHVTVRLEVTGKERRGKRQTGFVTLDCRVTNQRGHEVASGTAEVVAPAEKTRIPTPIMPNVSFAGTAS